MLSSCLALPREGHLQALFHIFSYLGAKHNAELVFDPSLPDIDYSCFPLEDWSDTIYADENDGQLGEAVPDDMPSSRGAGFVMLAFVYSDHARDLLIRRSRTGFLIYLNLALIHLYFKKQTSIETSSFGSEFVAMKQVTEYIWGLRYKLKMMGIPVVGCDFVFSDNQSVLKNSSLPDSKLNNKSNSIAYHHVREGVARDEWRTAYIKTNLNRADLLTKNLGTGPKRDGHMKSLLHHIIGDRVPDMAAAAASLKVAWKWIKLLFD